MLQAARVWLERLHQLVSATPWSPALLATAAVALAALVAAWPLAMLAAVLAGLAAAVLSGRAQRSDRNADRARPTSSHALPPAHAPDAVAPARLMAAPASWQSIIDALPDPVLALDSELIVVHANQAAHDLFPAMRLGGPVALASRSPELAEALARMVGSGERRTVGLHERFPVVRRLDVALASLAGRLPGEPAVLLVVHDVSERERLAQMRADFIAHASHELRTPLSALRGFIETLQGQARNDEAARERFLGIMAAESQRMTRILDDLLSLSRLEMRAHIAPSGRVDLAETLSAVIEALAPVAEAAGVTVSLARPEQPRFIRGDRDELVQLFSNLVQNAIKYGHRGGRVDVAASEERVAGRDVVRVTVADDGPGIAEVHLPRLTERFYRVDDRSSRAKGGTGLGLAIVKHILNRHGGELRIRSKVGEGSTFTVELPRADGK